MISKGVGNILESIFNPNNVDFFLFFQFQFSLFINQFSKTESQEKPKDSY